MQIAVVPVANKVSKLTKKLIKLKILLSKLPCDYQL